MLVARPTTLSGVFDALDELPGAHVLAAGTNFMADIALSAEPAASTG
jgi:hypothetical protein